MLSPKINTTGAAVQPAKARPAGPRHTGLSARSARYVELLQGLDAPPAELDVAKLLAAIQAELPLEDELPVGCVARCYLGHPYEVHMLDLAGGVIEHFHIGQPLPDRLEPARTLALHGAYVAVEVYPGRLVCIRANGSAVEASPSVRGANV